MKKDKKEIIHKLNNHLASINLSAELLLKSIYGDLNEKQKQCAKGIVSEGKKIQKLVGKLQD